MNIAEQVKKKLGLVNDNTEEVEAERQPELPWHSYRWGTPSRRHTRRLREADTRRTTKRYYRRLNQQERAFNLVSEKEATRRLRAFETENHIAVVDAIQAHGVSHLDLAGSLGLLEEPDKADETA